ncbi:MAG: hypothetical protein SFU84_15010 [Gemmatimonadales bacterium]|nr:hypothetical protein [Gemmatimonadales bacterium]
MTQSHPALPFRTAFQVYHVDADTITDDQLTDICGGPVPLSGDKPILLAMLRGVKTVVVEREYIDKDYRNVYSAYYSMKFSRSSSRATRLHFFQVRLSYAQLFGTENQCPLSERLRDVAEQQGVPVPAGTTPCYIGNVVLRPTEYSRIGRCLLDPRKVPRASADRTTCMLARFHATLMGHRLEVSAFPHQSQDAEVHICAQTAVWGLFRYLSQKYPIYPEQYPHDIAVSNTDLRHGRPLPGRGLTMGQVAAMFGEFGVDAELYDLKMMRRLVKASASAASNGWASPAPIPLRSSGKKAQRWERAQRELLHFLEVHLASGLPSVIGLPEHAATAIGTVYATTPVSGREGAMLRSSDFMAGVLVNDDNYAPYQQLAIDQIGASTNYAPLGEDVDTIVIPLPRKVFLTSEKAEFVVTNILNQLDRPSQAPVLVRRHFCTSSRNYKADRNRMADDFTEILLGQPLPHFLWITEISECGPDGPGAVVAEVAVDATAGPYDAMPCLWIRYRGWLAINEDRLYGTPALKASPSYQTIRSKVDFPILTFDHNLTRFT